MQKLRILFYGDGRVPGIGDFSLSLLTQFIREGLKKTADVQIAIVHRHQMGNQIAQGANKLTWQFLENFDEFWIFGDKQANIVSPDLRRAEPYNELDKYEQAVLLECMKTRGLMLTGDHSDLDPNLPQVNVCSEDHSKFINLGAAIGRYVPRAHQLRVWDGPPTKCDAPLFDNQNTLEGDPSELDSNEKLQFDKTAQNLIAQANPHQLFSWINPAGQAVPITKFPDHQHEGKVLPPTAKDLDGDWPVGATPPQVIAWGKDKRPVTKGRKYALVAAFDGDPVNVGRIVADSSFHHYIDLNIANINGRDSGGKPTPGTDLDQIAQYYCNLALWLAPQKLRNEIKIDLFANLAIHPLVLDARGMEIERLGRAARTAAELEVGSSNLYQILGLSNKGGSEVNDLLSTALLTSAPSAVALAPTAPPSTEKVLGSIVQEFHDYLSAQGMSSLSLDETVPAAALVDQGLLRAFR